MKRGNKKFLIAFILIFLILFSYTIIISQTSPFPGSGGTSTGTGTQTTQAGTTPESQTKTGVENPPEKGTVGNEKQDLGGLVGLENQQSGTDSGTGSDGLVPVKPIPGTDSGTGSTPGSTEGTSESTPSLKGQNLDFKRDLNAKEGTQKTEITPNDKLGESKLELNGNEFSAKESKEGAGELGEAKFSIEKKEGEKFAETGAGTEYKVEGGEKPNGNAVDELAGRDVELSKETQVKITENPDGTKKVEMNVQEGGQIHQPGERKNGKEEEKKETDFRWFGDNLNWFDTQGNSHTISGELAWNQNLGFYVPEGKESLIEGVNIFSTDGKGNDFNTQIFSDGKAHSEALGSYASFGKDNLFTGSNNQNSGPYLKFAEGNKYGVDIDSPTDRFLMQANAGGQISLTNRNSQGLSPNIELGGKGGTVYNGDKSYISNGQRFDTSLNPAFKGFTSSSVEINPIGTNGNSLIGDNRYLTNNFNQGALVPNNHNFNTKGPYQYQGNNFDPRIGNNLINSPFKNSLIKSEDSLKSIRISSGDGKTTGFAHSDNFILFTDKEYSYPKSLQKIMETAESSRSNIAKEWLGQEIVKGQEKTTISLSNSLVGNRAGTIDNKNKEFKIFLDLNPNNINNDLGPLLKHEITHAIFDTKFSSADGKELARWVHEGIASRYDPQSYIETRNNILKGWAQGTTEWPRYQDTIISKNIKSGSTNEYSISTSTVDYLLTRNSNKQNLINAADYARDNGWDSALQKYYNIPNTGQLEREWRLYIIENYGGKQMDPNF